MIYPIAEIFDSLQGEGAFAGTRMCFIRFAGCTVGRPYTPEARKTLGLNLYQEQCRAWDGAAFVCDTDFRAKMKLTEEEIMQLPEVANSPRVCLTGGEPLMHDLWPLFRLLNQEEKLIHIETSGTIAAAASNVWHWLTVSPKRGYIPSVLEHADEIKILVGPDFNEDEFADKFANVPVFRNKLWVQPINGEYELNRENIERCMRLTERFPRVRLSLQLHKVLNIR